jgi:hypothetical protein
MVERRLLLRYILCPDGLASTCWSSVQKILNNTALWAVTACSLVNVYQCLRRTAASVFRVNSLRIEADICMKTFVRLCSITSLKMVVFVVTATRASDLALKFYKSSVFKLFDTSTPLK